MDKQRTAFNFAESTHILSESSYFNYLLPTFFTRYYFTIEEIAKLLRPSSLSRLSLFVTVVIASH